MADRPTPLSDRPVLVGLAALLSVAVVVGLLAGGVVMAGSRILGVGEVEASGSGDAPSAGSTLYLPEPVKTSAPSGPRITLNVDPEDQSTVAEEDAESDAEAARKAKEQAAKKKLTLQAGQTAVPAMGRIDLSGTHPTGEGAILQVQRKDAGAWSDFPVTVSVRGGAYTTYIVTGKPGETKFRVVDTDTGKKSNVVTVQVG